MIPKIIHYCWFGGAPLSPMAKKCIDSWKKYCPDYEIIEWNESNADVSINKFTKEAYDARSWGFATDYLRLWIIYNYGGVYLDTDVELVKSLDPVLENGPFIGFESGSSQTGLYLALGLGFGAEKGNELIKKHMEIYDTLSFVNDDGSYNKLPSPHYTTDVFMEYGLDRHKNAVQNVGGFTVYPTDYFCPIDTATNKLEITENTYAIHHFAGSWVDGYSKLRGKIYRLIRRIFGKKAAELLKKIFGRKG